MFRIKHSPMRALVLASTMPLGLAQIPNLPAKGPGSVLAAGISLSASTRGTAPESILIAPPQVTQVVAPIPYLATNHYAGPDFSMSAMFNLRASEVEIDAHDLGMGQLPKLDENGVPDIAAFARWASITVSVSNDSLGLPGSLTRQRTEVVGGRNTPGADLITHFLDGGVGIDASLHAMTFVSREAEDLGYTGNAEFDALDFGLGIMAEARAPTDDVLFPFREKFYFSISQDSADDLNELNDPLFALDGNTMVAAHPATIYSLEWLPLSSSWETTPKVYKSAATLGLEASGENIDALVVVPIPGEPTIVYSTQIVLGRSQLLIYGQLPNGSVVNQAFTDESGTKVATLMGLRDDDVLGGGVADRDDVRTACIIDPEANQVGKSYSIWRGALPSLGSTLAPMGIGVTRYRVTKSSPETLVINVTGGLGNSAPCTVPGTVVGDVQIWMSLDYDGDPILDLSKWAPVGTFSRLCTEGTFIRTHVMPSTPLLPRAGFCAVFIGLNGQILATSYVAQMNITP